MGEDLAVDRLQVGPAVCEPAPPAIRAAAPERVGRTQVSLVRPEALTEAQLAEWRRFQHGQPLLESPYLCPEFTRIVAGLRPGVLVAVAEEGGRPRAFFPFRRRGRVGIPVGGQLSDCQAVLAEPGWEWDASALVRACGLSVYDFTALRAAQRAFAPFHRGVTPSHVIDLRNGFEDYVREQREAGRGVRDPFSGRPHQTLGRIQRLEKQVGPLRVAVHDPDPRSLHLLIRWKREQYRRTGVRDVFSARWTVELLERIHATRTEHFAGVLSTLSVGDRIIAAHMGMRSRSVLHWWFPAYDTAYAKHSPGLILLLEVCRRAAEAGIQEIELGPGDEAYKPLIANRGIPVAAGFVGSASLPLWCRQLRHGTEALASRLPMGPAAQWPAKLFRRIERLLPLG